MSVNKEVLIANFQFLASRYPGRGVVMGLSEDGEEAYAIEFTGGRSEGSLNRKLVRDGGNVRTVVYNPRKQVGDAASTLYVAHCNVGDYHVVSNGYQTETIAKALAEGLTFEQAQESLNNEGPKGSYTSRIHGALKVGSPDFVMGKVKRDPFNFEHSLRSSYRLKLEPGKGYFLVTYDGVGGTDPFEKDPQPIEMPGTLRENVLRVWNTLNRDTRGSIAGKAVNMVTGEFRYNRVLNRNWRILQKESR